ncbi:integral peroxisomal membrane peroxin-domain-containing protein [Parasitella parasitica]|nr:integral peroxisomal membrane peroxin-domain-containing protein [Parasitella parasitica]
MSSHTLEEANFSKPTYCDHCQGLLWGLVKQGLKCSGCGTVSHSNCQKELKPCTSTKLSENAPVHRKSDYDSPAANALRSLQQQHKDDGSFSPTPTAEGSSLSKLKKIATSEEFQNVLVSAAIHSSDATQPPNEYLANLPPLNPQNTAKNFSRFVSRCGPMFAFRDNVILLLSWNKPIDTLAALIIYCLICLHPKLILFVPHVILIQIIISGYTKKFGSKSEMEAHGEEPHHNQAKMPQPAKSTWTTTTSTSASSRFNFASAFFPAFDETSPEYLKNMQNLQNMMGEMSDIYDLIASNSHYVDWSSEVETMRLFQGTMVSLGALAVAIWFIPLNVIFLVGGTSLFLLNTRFAKFVLKEMLPQVAEIGQSQMNSAVQWYTQVEKRLDDQANIQELSLYENQRWWSGSGFIPHMLPHERGLWSDMSGSIELAPKEELPAPEGYHWVEDNWSLDKSGPWIDEMLGLEVMVSPENGGWVYTDNNWENPRNGSNVINNQQPTTATDTVHDKSVTRRRRWIRKCERNFNTKYNLSENSI